MRRAATSLLLILAATTAHAHRLRCNPDQVQVGPVCVDKYEASVWRIPPENTTLIRRLRFGRATLDDLLAGGATQVQPVIGNVEGCTGNEYGPGFLPTGYWTEPLYAASIPGVRPANCITWFQAQQACILAGKRLLRNDEWQAAGTGTPDPIEDDMATTCNVRSELLGIAGSRSACVSSWGIYDAIGNVWEFTADWFDQSLGCDHWFPEYGGDIVCSGHNVGSLPPSPSSGGAAELPTVGPHLPGTIIRGGNFGRGAESGLFAFFTGAWPGNVSKSIGFRCGR